MKQILVGTITKPQGIKGEVKMICYVDAPQGFSSIKQVYVAGTPYRVLLCRALGNEVFLTLEGVKDRNQAELLRGKEVTVDRDKADSLKKGEFFICDLVGLRVQDQAGESLGVLQDVLQYGAADIFDIRSDSGEYLVPYLKRLVVDVDLSAGSMTVDRKVWQEVCCEN